MDIWAVGCLIYEVISGEQTFPGLVKKKIMELVLDSDPLKLPNRISKNLRRLIWCMLRKEPSERPHSLHILDMELLNNFSKATEVSFELPQGKESSTATMKISGKTLKIKDSDYDSEEGFESFEANVTYIMTAADREKDK